MPSAAASSRRIPVLLASPPTVLVRLRPPLSRLAARQARTCSCKGRGFTSPYAVVAASGYRGATMLAI
jgi:hypothetical protein